MSRMRCTYGHDLMKVGRIDEAIDIFLRAEARA